MNRNYKASGNELKTMILDLSKSVKESQQIH